MDDISAQAAQTPLELSRASLLQVRELPPPLTTRPRDSCLPVWRLHASSAVARYSALWPLCLQLLQDKAQKVHSMAMLLHSTSHPFPSPPSPSLSPSAAWFLAVSSQAFRSPATSALPCTELRLSAHFRRCLQSLLRCNCLRFSLFPSDTAAPTCHSKSWRHFSTFPLPTALAPPVCLPSTQTRMFRLSSS